MPKLFIAGIALFLLLGAGYGAIQAARHSLGLLRLASLCP